jgi:hypothetical protein
MRTSPGPGTWGLGIDVAGLHCNAQVTNVLAQVEVQAPDIVFEEVRNARFMVEPKMGQLIPHFCKFVVRHLAEVVGIAGVWMVLKEGELPSDVPVPWVLVACGMLAVKIIAQ